MGAKLEQFFPDESTRLKLFERPNQPIEGDLLHADGARTPVELILRSVDYGGRPHYAIAVRDLQARKQAEQHIRFLAHHDLSLGFLIGALSTRSWIRKLNRPWKWVAGSRFCASTSTDLRRSTIYLDTRRVTRRFRPLRSELRER